MQLLLRPRSLLSKTHSLTHSLTHSCIPLFQLYRLVGDIYGGDYNFGGLDAATVAAAFGKLMLLGNRQSKSENDGDDDGDGDGDCGDGGDGDGDSDSSGDSSSGGAGSGDSESSGGDKNDGAAPLLSLREKKLIGGFSDADIAISLLHMIASNIGQLAVGSANAFVTFIWVLFRVAP
jgi:pantothenate kinase